MSLVKRFLEDLTTRLMQTLDIPNTMLGEEDCMFDKIERWILANVSMKEDFEVIVEKFRFANICPQCLEITFGEPDSCTATERL